MSKIAKLNILNCGVAPVALGVALIAGTSTASAQTTPPPAAETSLPAAAPAGTPDDSNVIIVTGSMIKRINNETASPVTAITSTDLVNSGYDTITSVLTNLTANGAGTLSANNSEAFAGGASGIALRGLSVGATLTLVDGHRLAPYPLSDDGERQFTDIQSIPFSAVDRIEVFKDGASSIYGSDAIAGVVNILLKKQIVGVESQFEVGTSQHGGGATRRIAVSAGYGDLSLDGYNVYVTAEYRQQSDITLSERQNEPWASLNYTGIGGNDLRPGAPNLFNAGQPATRTPYLVNPDGSYTFLGSGCNTAALNASQCTYQSPLVLLSPTRNINVLFGFTKEFDDGWEAKFRGSFFDSKGAQYGYNNGGPGIGLGYSQYPGSSFGGAVSNPHVGLPVPGIGTIANYTLPANYLGSGSQAGAYLQGVIPGLGLPTGNIDSKTYRAGLDVTGKVLDFDITASLGISYVRTVEVFSNYPNYSTLYTQLTTFDSAGQPLFNPLGGNSQAELNLIAPEFSNTATDRLYYAQFDATRKVASLPGGDLSIAFGVSEVNKNLNNPGPAPVLAGDVIDVFSTYASGSQNDIAEYFEADAHLFKKLDINGSVRDDYYNTYGNSITPKVGVTFKPISEVMLRGTFSKGFRAPAPAEIGKSSTLFGLGGFQDAVLCPNGPSGPFPAGTVPAACSEQIGFAQTTSSTLKPETSTSFTGGAVFEPIRHMSLTVDYYHIKIDHQIISASELPTYSYSGSNCLRGPDIAIPGVSDGNGNLITAVPIAGPLAACFAGYVNAQTTLTSGLDVEGEYKFKIGSSTIGASAEWTHIFVYNLTGPSGDTYHLAGTHGPSGVSGDTGNPRDHINAHLTFADGPVSIALSGYYIGSLSITDPSNGSQTTCAGAFNGAGALASASVTSANSQYCRVKSFTSINLVTSYKFNPKVTLELSVDNLFDATAPYDVETYGGSFAPFNPSADEDGVIGRFFRLSMDFKY
jgi:iron complex outermembrane receptor protein